MSDLGSKFPRKRSSFDQKPFSIRRSFTAPLPPPHRGAPPHAASSLFARSLVAHKSFSLLGDSFEQRSHVPVSLACPFPLEDGKSPYDENFMSPRQVPPPPAISATPSQTFNFRPRGSPSLSPPARKDSLSFTEKGRNGRSGGVPK